jgi:hypothetical protein
MYALIASSTSDLSYPLSPFFSPLSFSIAFIPLAFVKRRSTKCDLSTFHRRFPWCFDLLETETKCPRWVKHKFRLLAGKKRRSRSTTNFKNFISVFISFISAAMTYLLDRHSINHLYLLTLSCLTFF